MKCILGKKLGMTTLFDAEKGALNVTLIECGTNTVTLQRTVEKDGYVAIQVQTKKTKNKAQAHEFRFDKALGKELGSKELEKFAAGATLAVTQFSVGERVAISGITKSKGFQGVVKRHGFAGQMTSHGRKHDIRKPGSIGATFPEHVIKGRRMAGRMGGVRQMTKNIQVVYINEADGIIGVRGAVPGVNGRVVEILSLT